MNPRLSKGVQKYLEFHKLEPKKVNTFAPSMCVPPYLRFGGDMIDICYRSSKWEGKPHDYKHEHDFGVSIYFPTTENDDDSVSTPLWLQDEICFVQLGSFLSLQYQVDGEVIQVDGVTPYPNLYCSADGNALVIIEGRRKLMAVIYGGMLDVTARGIVG